VRRNSAVSGDSFISGQFRFWASFDFGPAFDEFVWSGFDESVWSGFVQLRCVFLFGLICAGPVSISGQFRFRASFDFGPVSISGQFLMTLSGQVSMTLSGQVSYSSVVFFYLV
jgi:hypothetical protein